MSININDLHWLPLAAAPRNRWLLLRGPSGLSRVPHRYIVAKHDAEYRPLQPWVDLNHNSVLDGGEMLTEWTFLD
jgi:hypothetical protein